MSECLLFITTRAIFSYIMIRVSYIHWNDDDIHFVLRPTCVVGFFIVLGHWNNSPLILVLVDMSLYSEHIILILNKSANTNFIVFGLTWTGLKPMMYYSWGKYATHYTTDVICRSKGKGLTTTNIVMYIVPYWKCNKQTNKNRYLYSIWKFSMFSPMNSKLILNGSYIWH